MRSFGWWGCLLALASCAPSLPVRQGWSPALDAALIAEHAGRELAQIGDLRAAAEITLTQAGARQHASAALLFKAPDLFRLEVRGPLFVHLFTALLRADSLIVGQADDHWSSGPFSDATLTRLLGLDLAGYDLRYALLGLVMPAPLDSLTQPQPGQYLAFPAGIPRRRWWLDVRRGFIAGEEVLDAEGTPLLVRRLLGYQRVGDLYLPRRVEIHQGENALLLEYRSWELDTGLSEAAFTRGIPLDRLAPLE